MPLDQQPCPTSTEPQRSPGVRRQKTCRTVAARRSLPPSDPYRRAGRCAYSRPSLTRLQGGIYSLLSTSNRSARRCSTESIRADAVGISTALHRQRTSLARSRPASGPEHVSPTSRTETSCARFRSRNESRPHPLLGLRSPAENDYDLNAAFLCGRVTDENANASTRNASVVVSTAAACVGTTSSQISPCRRPGSRSARRRAEAEDGYED